MSSFLQPPALVSKHDKAGYAAIVAGDEVAYRKHLPNMCVGTAHLGHAVALGIVYDRPFILDELKKKTPRFATVLRKSAVVALALDALDHGREAWLAPVFQLLDGLDLRSAVTQTLTELATLARPKEALHLLGVGLPMETGIARLDPLKAAIAGNHLTTLVALWPPLAKEWGSYLVVDALADVVSPGVRQFILEQTTDELLQQTTLVNASMKDFGPGLMDWWAEVQRRGVSIEPSEVDFALANAAECGAVRSTTFLMNTLTPRANPNAERWRALHEAAVRHDEALVRLMVPHADVLEGCKALMRRQKLQSGKALTAADKLSAIALIVRVASPEQQRTLVDHFADRLPIALAHQRVEQLANQTPTQTTRRRRLRS